LQDKFEQLWQNLITLKVNHRLLSSARQEAIDPDDRRIISPGNLGAVTGETNESITTAIIQILDVNNRNHIKTFSKTFI
jgi:hypothetical protein